MQKRKHIISGSEWKLSLYTPNNSPEMWSYTLQPQTATPTLCNPHTPQPPTQSKPLWFFSGERQLPLLVNNVFLRSCHSVVEVAVYQISSQRRPNSHAQIFLKCSVSRITRYKLDWETARSRDSLIQRQLDSAWASYSESLIRRELDSALAFKSERDWFRADGWTNSISRLI